MSDDDRLDFAQIFPAAGRNRKRHAANPRNPKAPKNRYGFFSPPRTEESSNTRRPTHRDLGKRYDDDAPPRPTLDKMIKMLVAKDLNRSAKSIMTELDGLGYEAAPLTVSTIREQMIAVLRLCQKYGSIIVPAWKD